MFLLRKGILGQMSVAIQPPAQIAVALELVTLSGSDCPCALCLDLFANALAFAFERSRAGGTRRISPNFSYRYWSEYWQYPVPRLPLRRRNQILIRRAA